jgi:hypothetical protein
MMMIIIIMSSPKLYLIFVISLIIITSVLFSSPLHPPALAFHTASTASVTIQTGEGTLDANNQSLPIETEIEIYNHTNKALQALSEGNTSEVENQLNFTKEKLSFVISNNESNQQSQGSNTTYSMARPGSTPNIDASGEAALDSREDTAAVETDTSNVGQGLNEREQMERFHAVP